MKKQKQKQKPFSTSGNAVEFHIVIQQSWTFENYAWVCDLLKHLTYALHISPPMLERNQSFALNYTELFSEKQEVEGEGTKKTKPFHLMECKFLCFPEAFVGR